MRVGVLLSGSGRTLENFFTEMEAGRLPIEIGIVISSHPGVKGLERASRRGVPTEVVDYRSVPEPEFSSRITSVLEKHRVSLVLMAGFIRKWIIPPAFRGKVLNIHPALLPDFGGQGMYGMRVHEAVHAAGREESGCTVHYVDEEYDRGPILLQRRVALDANDDPEAIAAKVFAEECKAYPEAIRMVLDS